MTLRVETFGCRLNLAESAAMRAAAEAAGVKDAIVVNTCAVTAEAAAQARQRIRRIAREAPAHRILVTGCAAEIDPAAFAAMPEVAAVFGNARKAEPGTWRALARGEGPRLQTGDAMVAEGPLRRGAAAMEGRARAILQVQTGCDHRCTFCVIPFGRGRARSLPIAAAIDEVSRLVEAGAQEVVLTGVDLTSWGQDLPGAPRLGALVRAILREVPELRRLRLSSIDGAEADDELLAALAEEERLAPHLHLSLQAGDDLILKRMRRRHSREHAIRFCERVRRLRPDVAFGADLIAGFPTEDEAMFRRTLDLIDECGVAYLHVFPFSPRPGTPAARMPQVASSVVRERAARLRESGAARLAAHLEARVGRPLEALAERGGLARAADFTPIRLPREAPAGTWLTLAADRHDGQRLIAA